MPTDTINEFLVEGVFPQHSDQTTVTGFMAKGAFHNGESVSLISAQGMPLLAPITRIGSAETPVNVVREGQKIALLLNVEPHHVVPGSRLTTRANDDAYGATMIVSADAVAGQTQREMKSQPELERAVALLDIRSFREALELLTPFIKARPQSCAGHLLMARFYLEADEYASKSKSLHHVKQAFELGGANDAAVLETLAMALGANGEAEHGLRYLERLYDGELSGDGKKRYAERIVSYRKRYSMPDEWQFVDQFGAVVFQSSNTEDIIKALKNGTISKEGECRKNKIGGLRSIAESLGSERPEIAALYANPKTGLVINLGIGACSTVLTAVLFNVGAGLPPALSAAIGLIFGVTAVLLLRQQRVRA